MREKAYRDGPSASEGGRRPTGDADGAGAPARPDDRAGRAGGLNGPGEDLETGAPPAPEDGLREGELDRLPRLSSRRKGRRLVKKEEPRGELTPEQRLLLLDTWQRSGLSAKDFSALVGVSRHTLYGWKRKFSTYGPEGLMDRPRGGPRGSRLPELTKRTILMMKREHPDWGCRRLSDMLLRGPALPASPEAVRKVLKEGGYELEETPTRPHAPKTTRFERSRRNELWQTDIFTFTLKRQNRRVYLVIFLDDHSRYVTSWSLSPSPSTAWVIEALRSGIASYGPPSEVLTDNGPQYVTWRGKSAFSRECAKQGVRQVVARPRRPQTLGKAERFWGTLWRECLETAIFADLREAEVRVGHFLDHYNFQRTHQGIEGLVPADRYFGAGSEVRKSLEERVEENALDLAREGEPKEPFYLTGKVGGKGFSVHTEGERVILLPEDGERREIELVGPGALPIGEGEPKDESKEVSDGGRSEGEATEVGGDGCGSEGTEGSAADEVGLDGQP